LCQRSLAKNSV